MFRTILNREARGLVKQARRQGLCGDIVYIDKFMKWSRGLAIFSSTCIICSLVGLVAILISLLMML